MTDEIKLTGKQKAFIEAYVMCLNASEAARLAGYAGNDATLGAVGYENLRKPQIKTEIDKLLNERTISADQVRSRLSEHSTADINDFISINEFTKQPQIDFQKAKDLGKLHLLKKVKFGKNGFVESIELHDSQSALVQMGRIYGMFKDRVIIEELERLLTLIDKAGLSASELFNAMIRELVDAGRTDNSA